MIEQSKEISRSSGKLAGFPYKAVCKFPFCNTVFFTNDSHEGYCCDIHKTYHEAIKKTQ